MKIFFKIIGYILIFIFVCLIIQHVLCPVYDYPSEKTFSGNKIYNPYKDLALKKKVKANFHAHSRTWLGITNGRDNDNESLVRRYKYLNYDISGISDYQTINEFQKNDPLYIPEYEHGFGFTKNHQLSIGTNSVLWNDYLFLQTTDNKQNIIKELKEKSELVVITHPELRGAYSRDDMKKLTDYNCIEVLNHNYGQSFDLWDAALSTGHMVFGLGDDDSHSSANPHDMGCAFNIIYCDSVCKSDIIKSLKAGTNIIVNQDGETMEIKRQEAIEQPNLISVDVNDTRLTVEVDKIPRQVDFVGQEGIIRKSIQNMKVTSYDLKSNDTYIRVAVYFDDKTEIYLNPVFRYNGLSPQVSSATIDESKTLNLRIISVIIILITSFFIIYLRNRKRYLSFTNAKVS